MPRMIPLALLATLAACAPSAPPAPTTGTPPTAAETPAMPDTVTPPAPEAVAPQPARAVAYTEFSRTAYEEKLGNEPMILFFHANWCPNCKLLDALLRGQSDRLTGDVTLFKVEYDREKELKTKYDIRTQHTLVVIGADGAVKRSVIGATTIADVQALVNAAGA